MENSKLTIRSFVFLLALVSVAFVWVLLPFYGPIFWATILSILFTPTYNLLLINFKNRRNIAALVTLLIILVMVVIPTLWTFTALLKQGISLYDLISSGDLKLGSYFAKIIEAMPSFVHETMVNVGLGDAESIRTKISELAMQASKFLAGQAVSLGQNTLGFLVSTVVMLYLLFFLLRDGSKLAEIGKRVIPLSHSHQQLLIAKFTTVIKATVKGNVLVASIQGALGGLIFWVLGIQNALLWAVIMAVLSLLPAVGASLIWIPVAIYFFATGLIWQGVVLTIFGVFVIGLIDSILRPILVGKDTRLPDYVILISTLGGMTVFGLNGFVIGPLLAALFMAFWDVAPTTFNKKTGNQDDAD